LSYGELDARASRLAHALVAHDVKVGDRVAIFMENACDYIVAYHGVGRSGAIFVPIVTQSKLPEVEYFIGHSEPVVLIVDAERWDVVAHAVMAGSPAFASLRGIWLAGDEPRAGLARFDEMLAGRDTRPLAHVPQPGDPVAFMYTSGSTGRPKAVIHSHYTA